MLLWQKLQIPAKNSHKNKIPQEKNFIQDGLGYFVESCGIWLKSEGKRVKIKFKRKGPN